MGIYRKGNSWFIDYYVGGYRKREKIGPSRKLAETVLAKRKIEIAENKYLNIARQEKIMFEDAVNEYLEKYSKYNKKCYQREISTFRRLNMFFHESYLHEINPKMVEDYKIKRVEEGLKRATVNRHLTCLKHLFTKMIEWGKARENPVKKVRLFRENN